MFTTQRSNGADPFHCKNFRKLQKAKIEADIYNCIISTQCQVDKTIW